jgi:hypothetical protein
VYQRRGGKGDTLYPLRDSLVDPAFRSIAMNPGQEDAESQILRRAPAQDEE